MFWSRTDLAVEERERFEHTQVEVRGVAVREETQKEGIRITKVEIISENGAKTMGKPKGNYITIEANDLSDGEEEYQQLVSSYLAKMLRELIPLKEDMSVLVVGLGNREVTPDSLGPKVVEHIKITRHIIRQFGKYAFGIKNNRKVSGMVPGVMAQTGMESLEMLQGIVKQTQPDYVIVVDALAARSSKRLNRTIQITDTGISPGSGVGNHRKGIDQKSIGIPVIAIGVPTVVDAVTIVADTLEQFVFEKEEESNQTSMTGHYEQLLRSNMPEQLNAMFVTPKDIDEAVCIISKIIADGINLAFCDGES